MNSDQYYTFNELIEVVSTPTTTYSWTMTSSAFNTIVLVLTAVSVVDCVTTVSRDVFLIAIDGTYEVLEV